MFSRGEIRHDRNDRCDVSSDRHIDESEIEQLFYRSTSRSHGLVARRKSKGTSTLHPIASLDGFFVMFTRFGLSSLNFARS